MQMDWREATKVIHRIGKQIKIRERLSKFGFILSKQGAIWKVSNNKSFLSSAMIYKHPQCEQRGDVSFIDRQAGLTGSTKNWGPRMAFLTEFIQFSTLYI